MIAGYAITTLRLGRSRQSRRAAHRRSEDLCRQGPAACAKGAPHTPSVWLIPYSMSFLHRAFGENSDCE